MSNRMRRVIIVAKDKADLLISLGNIAAKTFRSEPNAAYESVIRDLNSMNIDYLDMKMPVSDMPDTVGSWYFKGIASREVRYDSSP